jgi:hypothetical protein
VRAKPPLRVGSDAPDEGGVMLDVVPPGPAQ